MLLFSEWKPQIAHNNSYTSGADHFKIGPCRDYKYGFLMALLLRLRGGKGEGWACGRKARAIFLDVGKSFELPYRTLLCSATEETQAILSK